MKLITPQGEEWKNPVEHLQKIGVLSKARMIEVVTNRKYALNEKMKSYWNDFKEFSPELLSNISKDKKRNEIIISEILKYKNKKGIIFACSIEHADYLAFLIRRSGLNAASVSASTRTANRKEILRELKDGKLDFITNFGVLTTGFDDPQLNMIVLARPVISQVLFEQMVGRGLRGPKFGGTEECIIMDFADNVELHGQPLAYKRFRRLWD
jgi:superfamily II DNA or RNA helicase